MGYRYNNNCSIPYDDCGNDYYDQNEMTLYEKVCNLQSANEDIYEYIDSENESQDIEHQAIINEVDNRLNAKINLKEQESINRDTELQTNIDIGDATLQTNIDNLKLYVDTQDTAQDDEEQLWRSEGTFNGYLCDDLTEDNKACAVISQMNSNEVAIGDIANQLNGLTFLEISFIDGGRYPYDVGNDLNIDGGRV